MRNSILVLCVLGLLCSLAHSQTPAAGAAEAEFSKGRKFFTDGNFAEACTAFEHSQKLDPQNGTLFNLASCYEQLGKLASAWVAYREVAQRDTNATRKRQATDAAVRLGSKLAHLIVKAPAIPGLTVLLDAVDVTSAIGVEMPIDRGQFNLVANAPGYQSWTGQVVIAQDGTLVTQQIPDLVKDATQAVAQPTRSVPEEPAAACFPACRAGYACRGGRCESAAATAEPAGPTGVVRVVEPEKPAGPPRYQLALFFENPSLFVGDKAAEITPEPTTETTVWGRQTMHLGGRLHIRERGPLWLAIAGGFAMSHRIHYDGGGGYNSGDGTGAQLSVEQVLRIAITEAGYSMLLDHKIALDLAAGGFFMINSNDVGAAIAVRLSLFWLELGPQVSIGSQSGFNAGFTSGAHVAF